MPIVKTVDWTFPLPRTHTGILLGNGTLGAMVWGGDNVLRITLGRADFWDHRGGLAWTERMSFSAVRGCLESGDQKALWELFSKPPADHGEPDWPTVLPLGRFDLHFPAGTRLLTGRLNLRRGEALVTTNSGTLRLSMDMRRPLLAVTWDGPAPARIEHVPAWEYVQDRLASISFRPPALFADEDGLTGWVQERPADPPLCTACRVAGSTLLATAVYGEDPAAARAAASALLAPPGAGPGCYAALARRAAGWWRRYWQRVPEVDIPNARLGLVYAYGMYKFAGLTNPDGVPATLQGPWVEEYQMPPWSCDYHFNINVQMCYWPAYHGNCVEHLRPLFDLVWSWRDTLRHNAKVFLGIDDGLMLPHAVSDRCVCIGGYWAGSLDHGCTAWVAQMMYRYYRYTLDEAFLRAQAFPFMVGAMRVYEEMIEWRDGVAHLPVSVSPEYISLKGDAWGPDASFQYACMHRLCADLIEAAGVLNEPVRPTWERIRQNAPKACLVEEGKEKRIAIWRGTELEISHRHHSHLAGIVPFDVLHEADPAWRDILHASLNRWILRGPGLWSGWCVPWAAMLHTRFGQGAAAELLLESWERVFTNEGYGTLHDAHIPGFTLFGAAYGRFPTHMHKCQHEIMQIEAGMAAAAAVQEMLLHTRAGVTHVFAGTPAGWRDVRFDRMLTDGAFLVGATRAAGVTTEVRIISQKGGVLRLASPWPADQPVTLVHGAGRTETVTGPLLEIATVAGEALRLCPG